MTRYIEVCLICQQKKDHGEKKLWDPSSMEFASRRWGSSATDFIVSFSKTNKGLDSITAWVDRLSSRVHFIPCKCSNTSANLAHDFFTHILKKYSRMGCLIILSRIGIQNIRQSSGIF